MLWFDFVSADSCLKSRNKPVILLLLLLLRRFKTFEFLSLFFSNSVPLWSYWIRCFWQWIWCLNCRGTGSMMKILPWISESWWKPHWFGSNLLLKTVRVCEMFFNFLWVCCDFDLTEWREKVENVFVMWHWFCGPLFDSDSAWPYIGCHVAFEPMRMWHLDLDQPTWHLD